MKTVLITGANRGIGLGLVKAHLDAGWNVFACSRSLGNPLKSEKTHDRLSVLELDVLDSHAIERIADDLEKEDIVINRVIANAGVFNSQEMSNWTSDNFVDTFSVNAASVAILARKLETVICEGGTFNAISSGMGSIGMEIGFEGDGDAYAISKVALNMLCARLAQKWSSRNIGVHAISPGWVKTDMGGPDAELPVEESVAKLMVTFENLSPQQNGRFLSNEGVILPW
ncbi:SDR family NAD(P)-dependent oxidoreductase [Puniceicoccaceae bacterium K14]|nr:SDR family NAD(P)-dependent oxidoreductase [Puniceicoccaceae bacterium K14]